MSLTSTTISPTVSVPSQRSRTATPTGLRACARSLSESMAMPLRSSRTRKSTVGRRTGRSFDSAGCIRLLPSLRPAYAVARTVFHRVPGVRRPQDDVLVLCAHALTVLLGRMPVPSVGVVREFDQAVGERPVGIFFRADRVADHDL